MARSIEEVRIAKGDMFCPGFHLSANILHHHVTLNDPKLAAVDRNNGTVTAEVLAAAAGLSVAHRMLSAVTPI